MSDKTLILVQGKESALALVRAFEANKEARWVCYDVLGREALLERGIKFSAERDYYGADQARVNSESEEIAWRLAGRWYQDAPIPEGWREDLRPEMFFNVRWGYQFLVILKAFWFLESLSRREGKCRLVTTRPSSSAEKRQLIRWQRNESPLPLLLDHFRSRWAFSVEYLETKPAPATKNIIFMNVLSAVVAGISQKKCRRVVLFSGNPSLLGTVSSQLGNLALRCANVRFGDNMRALVRAFRPFRALVHIPDYSRKPHKFSEEDVYSSLKDKRTFEVNGIDFLPAVWPRLRNFYRWKFPQACGAFKSIQRAIDTIEPRAVVVDEDASEYNRMLVLAAKERAVPTFVVMHGLPGHPLGFAPLVADSIAVWGTRCAEILTDWGIAPKRMYLTGSPKYDYLNASKVKEVSQRKLLCRKFGWSEKNPMVLVTPHSIGYNGFERVDSRAPHPFDVINSAETLLRAAREVPSINIIYKFHAGAWDQAVFERVAARAGGLPPNFRWAQTGSAVDYIRGCDLVLNNVSSSGLEAVVLKKPFVYMKFSDFKDIYDLTLLGKGASITNYEEAVSFFKQLAQGRLPLGQWVAEQEALVQPYLFSRDGRSAKRTADFIRTNIEQDSKESGAGSSRPIAMVAR